MRKMILSVGLCLCTVDSAFADTAAFQIRNNTGVAQNFTMRRNGSGCSTVWIGAGATGSLNTGCQWASGDTYTVVCANGAVVATASGSSFAWYVNAYYYPAYQYGVPQYADVSSCAAITNYVANFAFTNSTYQQRDYMLLLTTNGVLAASNTFSLLPQGVYSASLTNPMGAVPFSYSLIGMSEGIEQTPQLKLSGEGQGSTAESQFGSTNRAEFGQFDPVGMTEAWVPVSTNDMNERRQEMGAVINAISGNNAELLRQLQRQTLLLSNLNGNMGGNWLTNSGPGTNEGRGSGWVGAMGGVGTNGLTGKRPGLNLGARTAPVWEILGVDVIGAQVGLDLENPTLDWGSASWEDTGQSLGEWADLIRNFILVLETLVWVFIMLRMIGNLGGAQ